MKLQTEIEFPPQNTDANQAILNSNRETFKGQCATIYDMLTSGKHLTTTEALRHGIGDLRARIRDLIKAGVPVQKKLLENRYKEYYL